MPAVSLKGWRQSGDDDDDDELMSDGGVWVWVCERVRLHDFLRKGSS